MRSDQSYKLGTAKETMNKVKRHPQNGRKHSSMIQSKKVLISEIYKQLIQLIKKTSDPVKKWAKDRHFSNKTERWPQAHENVFNIINREIQIKTTVKVTTHQSEWPSSKSPHITNAGEGVRKRRHTVHCWWECKWYSHHGKQYESFVP